MNSILVFAALVFAIVSADERLDFGEWSTAFSKQYVSDEERELRFSLWATEKQKIREWNSATGATATFALNALSDRTPDEKRSMLGFIPPSRRPSVGTSRFEEPLPPPPVIRRSDPPTNWNWCDHGACGPIRDQGVCGSCWIFAAIGALESQWAIATGSLVNFSHQQAIDCNSQLQGTGCCGGWSYLIYGDIKEYATESDYGPYLDYYHSAGQPACRQNLHPCKTVADYPGKITGFDRPSLSGPQWFEYLFTYGPATTGISVENEFFSYSTGIFSCTRPVSYNHEIVIVGYGVDTPSGKQYLIGRNSWGTSWGLAGYFKLDLQSPCGAGGTDFGAPVVTRPHVLANWSCDPMSFNSSDGCDCGCGQWDPDCDLCSATVKNCATSPSICLPNATCLAFPGWTCEAPACNYNNNITCNCGCGIQDPDCLIPGLPNDCGSGKTCNFQNVCQVVPYTWKCPANKYNTRDGCDCGCGAPDPDCTDPLQLILGCPANNYCENGLCFENPPPEWICAKNTFNRSQGCDCNCGTWDPDCGRCSSTGSAKVTGCTGFIHAACGLDGLCHEIKNWTCGSCWFAANDGCDCNCSLHDPDCDANSTCVVRTAPYGWTCSPGQYGTFGNCDCNCGRLDPDCQVIGSAEVGCQSNPTCIRMTGVCKDNPPAGWTCSVFSYNGHNGCNCGCGIPDPDCTGLCSDTVFCNGMTKALCSAQSTCINISSWACSACSFNQSFGTGDGCNCSCSTKDPDCTPTECDTIPSSSSTQSNSGSHVQSQSEELETLSRASQGGSLFLGISTTFIAMAVA